MGVGSLAASTPYLAIILATIIGACMTAPSAHADLSPHPEALTQTPYAPKHVPPPPRAGAWIMAARSLAADFNEAMADVEH